jgi:hypothetical protein
LAEGRLALRECMSAAAVIGGRPALPFRVMAQFARRRRPFDEEAEAVMTTQLADSLMRFATGDSRDEMKPVELVSTMSLEECCRRLRARMDDSMFGTNLTAPVVGRIARTDVIGKRRLSCSWNPANYMKRQRNSFRTQLSAELIDQSGQTRIICRFSMHSFVLPFMAIWVGILLLFIVGTLRASPSMLTSPFEVPAEAWPPLFAPIGMLIFGFGLVRFGRYGSRGDRQVLLAFIRETLMANPA